MKYITKNYFYSVLFLALTYTSAGYAQDTIPDIIASFPFNGNTSDLSKNAVKAIAGTQLTYVAGRNNLPGTAIYSPNYNGTDGAARVSILDSVLFKNMLQADFTISWWIKYDMDYSVGKVFNFDNIALHNSQFIDFCERNGNRSWVNWNNLVFMKQNDTIYEYFNTELCQTYPFTNFKSSYNKGYSIAENLRGAIDDMQFYGRALNPKEISQLFNQANITSSLAPDAKTKFFIFPNPATAVISTNTEGTITLFDCLGTAVVSTRGFSVPLTALAPGVYTLKIETDGEEIFYRKFIKE